MNITKTTINKVYKAKRASVETMRLKGYELIEELFVDSSGFGADNEPALTVTQFERELYDLLDQHGTLMAKITGAGQFQLYLGLFKKTGKSHTKRIANNTLEVIYDNGNNAIRLHDTDVITFLKSGGIKLDSGGWKTRTTKDRINSHTPFWLHVSQKDYEWFVHNSINGSTTPFKDGMVVKL